jgi:primosomal protein N' (replication factor Y)
MAIAKVEPLTTARALRGPFDYRLSDELCELGVGIGSVLLVPFGHRRVLGVVVEVAATSDLPAERLAEPLSALDAGVPPDLVRLGLWVAREYCSTPSRGLQLVLPPGTGAQGTRVKPLVRQWVEGTAAGTEALESGHRLGARQRAVLEALLAGGEGALASELAALTGADHGTLRRLAERGLVELSSRQVGRRPGEVEVGARGGPVALTGDQRAALERIVGLLDAGPHDSGAQLLLHGVTGSGKTEVYLGAVAAALAQGRSAIVLVPEIGLTPQTVARFRRRFGDQVAVLHSKLGAGERLDEWRRLRSGEARVCVGPRSAVFAPLSDLGLIVVDEEHDASYKQESDPRYDAREVARRRAADAQAVLVLGSATPRPESWHAVRRISLPERVDGSRLPEVRVLDMRDRHGAAGPLHPETLERLHELRDGGGKGIVLLNRRGWAAFLSCRSCGRVWECPECDVSLVLHRGSRRLACHHCGHAEVAPELCPDCGSASVARHGAGTEQIEAVLAEHLDPLPVFRLDSDSAARAGGHVDILRRFDAAESGVLLGTQMVAKGHDFPDVVLAVVLDADASLRFPDFRAEERTFSLVAQLAGRSGRGRAPGTVLVQTLAPESPAIAFAARHDAPGFLESELERRRALRYPPYSHLVRIVCAAPEAGAADRGIDALAKALRGSVPPGTDILGPAPLFRVKGKVRRHLLLKATDRTAVVGAVGAAVESLMAGPELRDVALSVDVDPQ